MAAGIYLSRAYTGLGPPTTHGSGASRFVCTYVSMYIQVCTDTCNEYIEWDDIFSRA